MNQVSRQKKLQKKTVVGMRQHCCISAIQDLILWTMYYERQFDDLGVPKEIWMG
jgi:hypothetical protein